MLNRIGLFEMMGTTATDYMPSTYLQEVYMQQNANVTPDEAKQQCKKAAPVPNKQKLLLLEDV